MAGDCSSADGEKSGEATTHGFLSINMLFSTSLAPHMIFVLGFKPFKHQCSGYEKLPRFLGSTFSWTRLTKKFFLNPIFSEYPKGTNYRKIQGIP